MVQKLDGKKDLLVTNEITGEVFAVVLKGENQRTRLQTALEQEFEVEIGADAIDETPNDGVAISFKDKDEQTVYIQLLTAFVY